MNNDAESNRPSHILWQVTGGDDGDGRGYFHRIGAAWSNKKGTGFNLVLEAVPLTGRIAMLPSQGDGQDNAPAVE